MSRATMRESMRDYKRIQSADEINADAALGLIHELLVETHDAYIDALITIKRLTAVRKLRPLNVKELELLSEAREEKREDEEFYRSNTFQIYTLNSGIKGSDVIAKLKQEANQITKERI